MPGPLFTPGKYPVPIVQEDGWVPGPVWKSAENLAPTGIRSPGLPARTSVAIPTELPGPRERRKIVLEILKNRRYSWHSVRRNESVVNILQGAIIGKKTVGRPGLQYLKQVVRNTAADSYRAMERMACNNSRGKAANQSKD